MILDCVEQIRALPQIARHSASDGHGRELAPPSHSWRPATLKYEVIHVTDVLRLNHPAWRWAAVLPLLLAALVWATAAQARSAPDSFADLVENSEVRDLLLVCRVAVRGVGGLWLAAEDG